MVGRSWASDHRTPAGTAIMSPPHGAQHRRQTRWRRQISTVGDRSARAADATGTSAHGEVASTITGAKANPFAPASSAARRRAAQRQPNSCWAVGARNRRHRFAALIALGNDLRLLLRSPSSPPAGPGKHLRPLNRFRLGFGRKLSVRHVSNPLNAAGSTFGVHHTEMKAGPKGRLQTAACQTRLCD